MISEKSLIVSLIIVALITVMWVTARHGEQITAMLRREGPRPQYESADDAFVRVIHDAKTDMDEFDTGRLPTLAERTDMMAALRTDCPDCGEDHLGACAGTDIAVSPVLTGVVVPGPAEGIAQPVHATRVAAFIEEVEHAWHWLDGRWHPPASKLDGLAKGDWLHSLLVGA